MRRCVVLLLAVFVLLQASWAAAATYCRHGDTTAHFGHHAHAHSAEETAGKPGAENALLAADMDHVHCHLSPIALPAVVPLLVAGLAADGPPDELACRVKTFVPEGLDRPNWLRA